MYHMKMPPRLKKHVSEWLSAQNLLKGCDCQERQGLTEWTGKGSFVQEIPAHHDVHVHVQ